MDGAEVTLNSGKTWRVRERIGDPSGLAVVHRGEGDGGAQVAMKFVTKDEGADRELLFTDLADDIPNVMPILDTGEHEDHLVLVMPLADKSLRQHMMSVGGPLGLQDALTVLRDVAEALDALRPRVVHRDIKPANVLFWDGKWRLADFGISRYAETTTADVTRKMALTPTYAAPEQWRFEHAESPADIYAFGVMAFEMIEGHLPFLGPDFRDQHLHSQPPVMKVAPALLEGLVKECMFKPPQARPTPANLVRRLSNVMSAAASPGLAKLAEANRAAVTRQAEEDAEATRARTEEERRAALTEVASQLLLAFGQELQTAIASVASQAVLSGNSRGKNGWSVQLGSAKLHFSASSKARAGAWGGWESPSMDVIAYAGLQVKISTNRSGWEGRSHSLWYCDAVEEGAYGWFETAFMITPGMARVSPVDPFALDPGEEAAKALWPGMAEWQVAWPFTPMAQGALDEFVERWVGWFGDAAQDQLHRPNQMPERNPQGSWRR